MGTMDKREKVKLLLRIRKTLLQKGWSHIGTSCLVMKSPPLELFKICLEKASIDFKVVFNYKISSALTGLGRDDSPWFLPG